MSTDKESKKIQAEKKKHKSTKIENGKESRNSKYGDLEIKTADVFHDRFGSERQNGGVRCKAGIKERNPIT